MKTIIQSVLVLGFSFLAGRAEVIDVVGTGGAYYEVHLEPDGHHWFYIIPGDKPVGGSLATVDGLKNGKPVVVFYNITNATKMDWVKDPDEVQPVWRAFSFAVRLDLVDKLTLIQVQSPQGNTPGGTITKTDLLWLVSEAKKTGRFRNHSGKAKASSPKNSDAESGPRD